MGLELEIPPDDLDLIDMLKEIPGAEIVSTRRFDGHDMVLVAIEFAIVTRALASTTGNIEKIVNNTARIIQTIKKVCREGCERHRRDPDFDFRVSAGKRPFINSSMTKREVDRQLDQLDPEDDRFK